MDFMIACKNLEVFIVKVSRADVSLNELKAKAVSIFVFEDKLDDTLKFLGDLSDMVRKQVRLEKFRGKSEKVLKVTLPDERIAVVFLVGLGLESNVKLDDYRTASAIAINAALESRIDELYVFSPKVDHFISQAVAEGGLLGAYRFDRYKGVGSEGQDIQDLYLIGGDEDAIRKGTLLACGQNYARDLANEPPNVINPLSLADIARNLSDDLGLDCRIYDEKELADMGMNALLAVGKGSVNPPRLIHLTFKRNSDTRLKVALVGKGLTFDSGGLDIKTPENMRTMKGDKTGACIVLGVAKTLAELNLDLEVHVLIGAVENMPSGSSYKPDDIIKTYSGKTIEIDNTDAEGRVTMADVLSFTSKLKPSYIIDIATLTGACAVALGPYTAGLFSNDQALCNDLLEVSAFTGERFWQLPMDDERLRKRLDSPFADLLNSAGRYGGAITAAMFLREFVDEGISWSHMDIAGVNYYKESFGYYPKGSSAFGTRTILEWLSRL